MIKIFKNLIPYWKTVVIIVLLLVVQAYGDLSLPQYTSDIIDVGIQNNGIEHILPKKMLAKEYNYAEMYMTDNEKESFEASYLSDGADYALKELNEKEMDSLDDELLTPIVLTYKMANINEADFKKLVKQALEQNEQTRAMSTQIDSMSMDEIGQAMKVSLDTFEAEDENGVTAEYVDMRPLIMQMLQTGQADSSMLSDSRKQIESMLEATGSSTIKSMGLKYAADCDKAAGIDIDAVQTSYLWSEGLKMLLIALIMMIAAAFAGFFASRVGAGIGRDLRKNIFTRVVSFSNTEMDEFSTASLITRSTNDIQQIQMVTTVLLRMVMYAPIIGIGGIIKVAQTGAGMGWIIVLAVLVITGFVGILITIAMPKFKIMQKLVDQLNLVAREILTGLSVIRAFGREKTEEKRFDEANRSLTRTQLFTNRVMTFMMPGMMMIMYCVTLLIVWVSAQKIDAGTLQVGTMTAFITYAMQIVMSFLMLTAISIMLPRAGVAADRIDEVINTHSTVNDPEKPVEPKTGSESGVVCFDDVSFKYPGAKENALNNISFTAKPGKTTAIIGSTGCGKSTLINLIPRFYDVTQGSISIDGIDVRNMSMSDLRHMIGFVPQKGILFSGTVASNLRFGCDDADDDTIQRAAQIAQATEFIESRSDGYDSPISQGGANVSGGQKQRLAIARAIACKPRILVFDDSFSALDMKTDAELRKALAENVKDTTVIIVAQRISTIMHADQIIVLDDGVVAGIGTHDQLLRSCQVYAQIASSQLSDKELGMTNMESGKQEVNHAEDSAAGKQDNNHAEDSAAGKQDNNHAEDSAAGKQDNNYIENAESGKQEVNHAENSAAGKYDDQKGEVQHE